LLLIPRDPRLQAGIFPENCKKRRHGALAHMTAELYKNSLKLHQNTTVQQLLDGLSKKLNTSFKSNQKFSALIAKAYPQASPSITDSMSLQDKLDQHLINYIDELTAIYGEPCGNQKLYELIQFIKNQLRKGNQFAPTDLPAIENLLDKVDVSLSTKSDIDMISRAVL